MLPLGADQDECLLGIAISEEIVNKSRAGNAEKTRHLSRPIRQFCIPFLYHQLSSTFCPTGVPYFILLRNVANFRRPSSTVVSIPKLSDPGLAS